MKATETYYQNKIADLQASVQRVRDLHTEVFTRCSCCDTDWPCSTIQALDGNQ